MSFLSSSHDFLGPLFGPAELKGEDLPAGGGNGLLALDAHHVRLTPHFDPRLRPRFGAGLAAAKQSHELVENLVFVELAYARTTPQI